MMVISQHEDLALNQGDYISSPVAQQRQCHCLQNILQLQTLMFSRPLAYSHLCNLCSPKSSINMK